jgi:hypothetical protein
MKAIIDHLIEPSFAHRIGVFSAIVRSIDARTARKIQTKTRTPRSRDYTAPNSERGSSDNIMKAID